ncbi:MFS transporter [Paraburkholderia sp. J76]|uniref:MFS transporter n=1 Tax=Paraburkholderia sp. J76 TaxID=2805439 RepID=UPI002ABDF020|nr:MFS transporter [Paraburkholderia sp. J76]
MSAENYQPAKAWRTASLLFCFTALNYIDKLAVGMLAVPLMVDLKLTPTQFGLVGSSFFWLFAVAGVAGGFAANRIPATRMLLLMALTWSVLQIPMALSSSLAVLVVCRLLLGVAEGPAFPVAIHACYKWFPDRRRDVATGVLAQGGAVGMVVAGIVIPLVTTHWGWRANFYVLALTGLLWVLVWRAFGREGNVESGAADADPALASMRVPYRHLLRRPTVLTCFVLHFAGYWCFALAITWLPAYLQIGLGYPAIQAGRVYALLSALIVVSGVVGPMLVARLLARGVSTRNARGRVSALMFIVAGVALMSVWFTPYARLGSVIAISLAFASPAVYVAMGPALLAEVVPASQRAAVLAIDNSIASIAGFIAPLVTGRVVEHLAGRGGYEASFAICGAMMLASGLLAMMTIAPEKDARALSRYRRVQPAGEDGMALPPERPLAR